MIQRHPSFVTSIAAAAALALIAPASSTSFAATKSTKHTAAPASASASAKPGPTYTAAQRMAAIQAGSIHLKLSDVPAIGVAEQMRANVDNAADLLAFIDDPTARRRIAEAMTALGPAAREALAKSPKGVGLAVVMVESVKADGEAGAKDSQVKSKTFVGVGEPALQTVLTQVLATVPPAPPPVTTKSSDATPDTTRWKPDPSRSIVVCYTLDGEQLKAGVVPYAGFKAALETATDKELVEIDAAKQAREAKKAAEVQKERDKLAAEVAREKELLKEARAREAREKEMERLERERRLREEREAKARQKN
ncbi:MAG: hypothetical protein NTW19_03135 [Planctomycetota bacterium]|nr:hypothetical protein [Planctomycetota bacterium]